MNLSRRSKAAPHPDRHAIAQAAYPSLSNPEIDTLMMDSFFPDDHWGYVQPSTLYPYDPDAGRALLEQAGWTLQPLDDYRTNAAGEELAIKYTSNWSDLRLTIGETWEAQMGECGIHIVRLHADTGWWFGDSTGLARRDFDIGEFAWVWSNTPPDILSILYSTNYIPSAANGWVGQNYNGWYDPVASTNAQLGDDPHLSLAERRAYYAIVQERFANQVPSIPLFERDGAPGTWEHIDFNMTILPQLYWPLTHK
jgi:ABC-type transport system substrate-binding protein